LKTIFFGYYFRCFFKSYWICRDKNVFSVSFTSEFGFDIRLDFLFFLCGFNDVVRLGSLLAVTFTLTSAGFVTLTQAFVFNS
jgi:hypothetical protein